MRRVAAARGLGLVIEAGTQSDLDRRLPEFDALLVGAHLGEAFPRLSVAARAAGVAAVLLPAVGFDAAGASVALGLLGELPAASAEDQAAVTEHSAVVGGPDNAGSSHG